jgi:hypothetical protein
MSRFPGEVDVTEVRAAMRRSLVGPADRPQASPVQTAIILQQLLRMRALVGLMAVLALVAGGLVAFRPGLPPQSRSHTVGVGSARALIDTPHSQVIDLGLKQDANAGVLPARAVLLANLLTTSPLKDETARRAGVPSDRLIAVADTPTDSGAPVQKPVATGTSVSASDPTAYVLTAHTDESLPLITVNTRAADAATATRLANAALEVLQAHVDSLSGDESIPAQRRLVVKVLGAARGGVEQRGPAPVIGIVLAVVIFAVLCGLLVLFAKVAREWRIVSRYHDRETGWRDPSLDEARVLDDGSLLMEDGVVTALPLQLQAPERDASDELRWDAR